MYRRKPKAFDMARSILPSTNRKGARKSKRLLHKKNRAEIRERLNSDDFDNEALLDHCWTPRYMQDWDTIVYDRRAADKLNHFVRWAKEVTKDIPLEDKLDHIRPMLPNGVIGTHAESHLYELNPNSWRNRPYSPRREDPELRIINDKVRIYNQAVEEAFVAIENNDKAIAKFNHNYYQWCLGQAKAAARYASGWRYDKNRDVRWYEICEPVVDNYLPLEKGEGESYARRNFFLKLTSAYRHYIRKSEVVTKREDTTIRAVDRFISTYFKIDLPKF